MAAARPIWACSGLFDGILAKLALYQSGTALHGPSFAADGQRNSCGTVFLFDGERLDSYEEIQADVFDHVLAVIPEFDLRVFQSPSGADVQRMAWQEKN